jgi:hypothetical protein
MKRMFQEEEENDVAVMEPPCITKQGKTVYLDDILGVVELTKVPQVSGMSGKELLDEISRQPKNGKDKPQRIKEEIYINMAELVERMGKNEGLDLFDAADRVHEWIDQALKENRKITVSFKDAEASHPILGYVVGDIYDRYPEELIEANLKLADVEKPWKGALRDVVSTAKLHRDDPQAYEKLMDDLDRIAMGDY